MVASSQLLATQLHRSRLFYGRYSYLNLARTLEELATEHLSPSADRALLDYGCGTMPFRHIFAPYAGRYLGADLEGNEEASLTLTNGRLPVADASVDIVLSTQVLEHVDDPGSYLRECFRAVRPGGWLLLSTHGHWCFHSSPDDFWRWTHRGLRRIVDQSGFETVEIRGSMNLLMTGCQLFQDGLRRALPRPLALPFVVVTQNLLLPLLAALSPKRNYLDAAVLVVAARRPR